MESSHDLSSPPASDAGAPPVGELVVQNGRLAGVRRPLQAPITTLGRAEGCDLRLNVDGVSPLHCAILAGPAGLVAQDLRTGGGTFVNGEPLTSRLLQRGDVISIGPFSFALELPEAVECPTAASQPEEEALRIQAAAVAAQQAALAEEELRLHQRRLALEQQEQQLATHLGEKRARLLKLRDDVRKKHRAMKEEEAAYERRVVETTKTLTLGRKELSDGRQQVQSDRQRLVELHMRMKRRWHRHWQAERQRLLRAEEGLAQAKRDVEKQEERLRQEKATLNQARLRFNGESELGRRQLQESWEQFHRERRIWEETRARSEDDLARRQDEVAAQATRLSAAETLLASERASLEGRRGNLEREAVGLENRIRNLREQLAELEARRADAEPLLQAGRGGANAMHAAASPSHPPAAEDASENADLSLESLGQMEALEALAGDLADQRAHLAEQAERLRQAQSTWSERQALVRAEFDAIASKLQAQAEELGQRDEALQVGERELSRQREEMAALNCQIEATRARLAMDKVDWEGNHDRRVVELRAREELAEQRLVALDGLRQRWADRRRKFLVRLREDRAGIEALRQQLTTLRDECQRLRDQLAKEQRSLAESNLALEQYRLELVAQSEDPKAAEQKLERLRRRWSAQSQAVQAKLSEEGQRLRQEAARLEEQSRELSRRESEAAAQGERLASERLELEQKSTVVEIAISKAERQAHVFSGQRAAYETQLAELRSEVEHLARLLYEDSAPPTTPLIRAA